MINNAQEVRLGNWVLIPNNRKILIPVHPKQIKGISKFGELDFTEHDYQEELVFSCKHCGGIELTDDILLKCGFNEGTETVNEKEFYIQKTDGLYRLTLEFYINKKDDKYFIELEWDGYGSKIEIPIMYVHELQNLYLTLTGKELQIKPEDLI